MNVGESVSKSLGGLFGDKRKFNGNVPQRTTASNSVQQNPAKNLVSDEGSCPHLIVQLVNKAAGGIVRLTPVIARRILEETRFEGQRKIRPFRKQEHAVRFENGQWIEGTSIIEFAITPDGQMFNVDGQHRLCAIADCGRTIGTKVNLVYANDMDEVRRIYASHDQKSSVRTTFEILDSREVSKQLNLPRHHAKALFDSLPILRNNMLPPAGSSLESNEARSFDERIDEIATWAVEMCWYSDIVKTARNFLQRKMLRAGCTAVAMYTLRHQQSKAKDFWSGLASDDRLNRNDPRKALIADMMTRKLSGNSVQNVLQPAVAWNAFYRGGELRIIKCYDDQEINIAGTPLGKRTAK